MKYNETGHARNVAHFEELITVVQSIPNYNPAANMIQINNLITFRNQLKECLQSVNDKNASYRDKIYARQTAFEKMSALAGRIVAMMAGLGMDEKILSQARSVIKKIRGGGSKKKAEGVIESVNSGDSPVAVPKKVSVSQMSFDQRKSNFNVLVSLLAVQNDYVPNEDELKVVNLQLYLQNLEALNEGANKSNQELIMARQKRDDLLYKEVTGALAIAQQVKSYIKAAFGTKSNEYERIKDIKFTYSGY
jgi:hypothetical protein